MSKILRKVYAGQTIVKMVCCSLPVTLTINECEAVLATPTVLLAVQETRLELRRAVGQRVREERVDPTPPLDTNCLV